MAVEDRDGSRAAAGLVAFAGTLRELGLEIGVFRVELALKALDRVDASDREDAYWALRCALISGIEQAAAFDAAFAAMWDGAPVRLARGEEPPAAVPGSESSPARERLPQPDAAGAGSVGGDEVSAGRRWSANERLRELDFREYGAEELSRAARLVGELARLLPRRRSRRLRPARAGAHLDRRATLRAAMRTEGHPVQLAWRHSSQRPRKLVFAIDVSGSMEPYVRPLMMFLQAARQASREVDAFAFGTRLTRLTDELGGRYPDTTLERVARAVPDWAGGTRIGDNLKRLNDVWGRRGVTRGAVVVIVSDGWERGDLELLRGQMERLQRHSHRLIWVNPLAGDPGYEPLAAGMATALPFVDVFLPGHNLRSLEALVAALTSPFAGRVQAGRRGTRSPSLRRIPPGLRSNPHRTQAPSGSSNLV